MQLMSNRKKRRIDQLLVERGYFVSRERAKRSLMAGVVFYEGEGSKNLELLWIRMEKYVLKRIPVLLSAEVGSNWRAA